jgi:hypothetical protein
VYEFEEAIERLDRRIDRGRRNWAEWNVEHPTSPVGHSAASQKAHDTASATAKATMKELDAHRKGVEEEAHKAAGHMFQAEDEIGKARNAPTQKIALGHAQSAAKHAKAAHNAASSAFSHAMGLNHKDAKPGDHERALDRSDQAHWDADKATNLAKQAHREALKRPSA